MPGSNPNSSWHRIASPPPEPISPSGSGGMTPFGRPVVPEE